MGGASIILIGETFEELIENIKNSVEVSGEHIGMSIPTHLFLDSRIEIRLVCASYSTQPNSFIELDEKKNKYFVHWFKEKKEVNGTDWIATFHLGK